METKSLLVGKDANKSSYGISIKTDPFKNKYIPIISKSNINDDNNDENIISTGSICKIDSINNSIIVKFTQRYQPYILTFAFISGLVMMMILSGFNRMTSPPGYLSNNDRVYIRVMMDNNQNYYLRINENGLLVADTSFPWIHGSLFQLNSINNTDTYYIKSLGIILTTIIITIIINIII